MYLSTHGRSYRVLAENLTVPEILWINIKKIAESTKKYPNPVFSSVEILLMVAQNYIIHSKELNKHFQMHLSIWSKLVFVVFSSKYIK